MNPRRLPLAAAVCLSASLALGGCTWLGAAASLFEPRRVPPVHTLPEGKKVAVIVDDWRQIAGNTHLTGRVASIAGPLLAEHAHMQVVPPDEVQELITRLGDRWTGKGRRLDEVVSAASVGQALGADRVVYAELTRLEIPGPGGIGRPVAEFQVKVFDCRTGNLLFPADGPMDAVARGGHPLATQLESRTISAESPEAASAAEEELARNAGRNLAELFYRHLKPGVGSRL